MKRWLLLAWMVLLPAMFLGNDAKLAPELKQKMSDGMVAVIVQYHTVPGKAQLDEIQRWGGKPGVKLALIHAVSAQLPTSAIIPLSNEDAVAYISPDRSVRAHADGAALAVLANYAWGLGFDGSGIGIAVVDSGIHDGNSLRNTAGGSRVLFSLDLVGGGNRDNQSHGTLVANIIGGNGGGNSAAVSGIAPNATLVDLRVLDNSGSGVDSAVIAAIQAAVQLKDTYNIRVLNLSLGRPVRETYALDPLCQAVEQAWKAGIVVVVSSGNDGRNNSAGTNGYATIEAPGNDPYVVTVGAINTNGTPSRADDVMTSFSSKGPTAIDHIVKPDLVAPGNGVSVFPQPVLAAQPQAGLSVPSGSGNYVALSGTSAASAVVSGAAALILQQDPTLTPEQVKARLMKTADKNLPSHTAVVDRGTTYNVQSDVFTVGAGYLDLQAALMNTDLAPGVAKSPTAYYDPSSGNAYFLADSTTPWGNSAMWGGAATTAGADIWSPAAVWGENVFLPNSAMWGGNSAMWGGAVSTPGGSSTVAPNSAMWGGAVSTPGGSSTVAPNSAMWGGAVSTPGGSSTVAPNSAMWGGAASTPGGSSTVAPNSAMWGGAVSTPGGSSTVAPNSAMWGGAVSTPGGSSTVTPNSAMWGGAASTPGGSSPVAPNSVMCGGAESTPGGSSTVTPNSALCGGAESTPGGSSTVTPNSAMWGGAVSTPGGSSTVAPNSAMWGGAVSTPDGTSAVAPNSAEWGGAVSPACGRSTVAPNSAMWGGAVSTPGGSSTVTPNSAMWGGAVST